jgi:hypothetical protein
MLIFFIFGFSRKLSKKLLSRLPVPDLRPPFSVNQSFGRDLNSRPIFGSSLFDPLRDLFQAITFDYYNSSVDSQRE